VSRAMSRGLLVDRLNRLTIRHALLVGFIAIFALWIVSGYYLGWRLTELERRASLIHARFAQSEELLLTVAAQVLLGTVYVRDAMVDTDPESAAFYRQELQNARTVIEQALQQYLLLVESAMERDHWAHLRTELNAYWDVMILVMAPEITVDSSRARAVLREQVVPKRRVIVQIADQIRTLNQDAFHRQEAAMAVLYQDLRRGIWTASGVAVVLGMLVAFGATRYAGGLEAQIRTQHVEDVERKRELERLSAKLVGAQEDERRTIARELHDEVGQALTAIKIGLSVAYRNLKDCGQPLDSLTEARSITDGALQAVRDVSQLLHPTMLDDLGLTETLNWYLRGFARRTGIRAELTQDRIAERMSAEVELAAYRIVQEGLTNVAKHASARACRVYVQRLPHSLLVTVEDDGVGFDLKRKPAADPLRGLGLVGIRERVSGLGGTLRLESTPGQGTRLSAELPVIIRPSSIDAEATTASTAAASVSEEAG
jgi:signal transduction histidine kinase